jgi:hypothetical protein
LAEQGGNSPGKIHEVSQNKTTIQLQKDTFYQSQYLDPNFVAQKNLEKKQRWTEVIKNKEAAL